MKPRATRRGEPLLVLGAIVCGWIGARAAILQAPVQLPERGEVRSVLGIMTKGHRAEPLRAGAVSAKGGSLAATPMEATQGSPDALVAAPLPTPLALPVPPGLAPLPPAPVGTASPLATPAPALSATRVTTGHALLWMAAVGRMPLPDGLAAAMARRDSGANGVPAGSPAPRRWSADGWLMLREGGNAGGGTIARYGASQTGAVLRYRLDTASPHRPSATLRATAALGGSREREVALGLSARPLPAVPVALHAELRASRMASGTKLRPAIFAVTELPRFTLPAGFAGEAYAQAGYVGGPAATAFVDGQLRIDSKLAEVGPAELRAGAGAWGGAQDGAGRLDIGPTATIGLAGGQGAARLGLDWRFRVAGKAAPASGPALTLSAGF